MESVATCYRLTQNCRNTREIALATSILSGVKPAETLVVDGPDVVEEWGSDPKELQKCVTRVLREWLDRGVDPQQITILSPRSYERSLLASIDPSRLPRRLVDVTKGETPDDRRIQFSTIAGFKGLEADAVLLIDLDDLVDPDTRALLYVGASRAKTLMTLILDESCREQYTGRASELVGRLVGRVAGVD